MSKVIVNNKMNEFFGNLALEVGINAIRKCAEKYGFDAEEAIELCGLDSIDNHVVFNKTKKGAAKKEPSTLQLKLAKPKFPFPYCGEYKKECCQGLKYNRGLFTQCLFIKTTESDYCKRCSSQAEKNDHGKPDCGSIQDRLNIGFMDFRDPKGRAPISFVKVMRKLKISQEALLEEAGKFNFEIHSIHFVDPPPPGKKGRKAAATNDADEDDTPLKKGRPSKKKEVVVSTFTEEADLFATLTKKAAATATTEAQQQQTNVEPAFFFVAETKEDNSADNHPHTLSSLNLNSLICPDSESSSPSTTPTMPPPPTAPTVSTAPTAPTAVKTAAKETSTPIPAPEPKQTTTKPAKKMTKEEKEAAKEAEKAAKIAAKEAEKAAKIAAKEAEKAAAKLAAKAGAKKTKAQAEEEAKKKAQAEEEAKKKAQAEEEESDKEESDDDEDEEDEEDEELAKQEEDEDKADELASVQLNRFKYAGKTYLKDQFDVIYDMGDGAKVDPYPIGKWNQKERSIKFNQSKIAEKDEGSDEEEEDEYEE
jgi:hypothetical protein